MASPDRSPSPSNVLVASASVESRAREPQVVQFGLADDQFELISKLDSGGQGTVYLPAPQKTGEGLEIFEGCKNSHSRALRVQR